MYVDKYYVFCYDSYSYETFDRLEQIRLIIIINKVLTYLAKKYTHGDNGH